MLYIYGDSFLKKKSLEEWKPNWLPSNFVYEISNKSWKHSLRYEWPMTKRLDLPVWSDNVETFVKFTV